MEIIVFGPNCKAGLNNQTTRSLHENIDTVEGEIRSYCFCFLLDGLGTLASAKDDAELIFSVIGDIPYSKKEVKILRRHVEEHNLYSPSEFFVHVGDIRGTNSKCKAKEYEEVSDILRDLRVPTYVIPGDNELERLQEAKGRPGVLVAKLLRL